MEEIDESQVDEHYSEFLDVMNFLNEDTAGESDFLTVWNNYSVRLKELSRGDTTILQAKRAAEDAMYRTVCRTERCSARDSADLIDDKGAKVPLEVMEQDIRSYVQDVVTVAASAFVSPKLKAPLSSLSIAATLFWIQKS